MGFPVRECKKFAEVGILAAAMPLLLEEDPPQEGTSPTINSGTPFSKSDSVSQTL